MLFDNKARFFEKQENIIHRSLREHSVYIVFFCSTAYFNKLQKGERNALDGHLIDASFTLNQQALRLQP